MPASLAACQPRTVLASPANHRLPTTGPVHRRVGKHRRRYVWRFSTKVFGSTFKKQHIFQLMLVYFFFNVYFIRNDKVFCG